MIVTSPGDLGFLEPNQREVLRGLALDPEIAAHFFLTGGTALSAFYFGHRYSDDLDLFSRDQVNLRKIADHLSGRWSNEATWDLRSESFLGAMIRGVKVDIVLDPLAAPGIREHIDIGRGAAVAIDTIMNIASNKLTTLSSRSELKDFLDFYFLRRRCPHLELPDIYSLAQKKDAQFDDPATVAYQIESALERIREFVRMWADGEAVVQPPRLVMPIDWQDFWQVLDDLTVSIYAMAE